MKSDEPNDGSFQEGEPPLANDGNFQKGEPPLVRHDPTLHVPPPNPIFMILVWTIVGAAVGLLILGTLFGDRVFWLLIHFGGGLRC